MSDINVYLYIFKKSKSKHLKNKSQDFYDFGKLKLDKFK
jgi:hypothetical protein